MVKIKVIYSTNNQCRDSEKITNFLVFKKNILYIRSVLT